MAPPLNVAVFTDGRPGHEKQTQSVLAAMASLTPLTMDTQRLPQVYGIKKLFMGMAAFVPRQDNSRAFLISKTDIIIGTGSTTHLPMIACKRRSKAKLVTCMSPDPLLRPCFDLCLVPRHDNPPIRRNIFPTFGPPCMKISGARHDSRRGLILAGGIDPKSHHWDTSAFMAQIRELDSRMPAMAWTISSSSRTPGDTIEQLRIFANERQNVTFFSSDETPAGWIESAYKTHAQVWVTADSVSMVYEALTAGCQVGLLPVVWKRPQNKFQHGIDDLKANGLILDYHHWQKGQKWPTNLKTLHEAERCASEILKRWWPERLV
jgi:mitochondrial fission protein ELM1